MIEAPGQLGRALEGVTVLDLTHMLSGPYATMLMADLGARTIKVEPPGTGEATRELLRQTPKYERDGMGAYFLTLSRNKESVAIDLKAPAGRELFYELVRHADVVVSNFGVGVLERLEIDHARLTAVNPGIITCAISGFGETGPARHRPAFDLVAQGMGGGMSLTGREGDEPTRAGIPIGDLGGGLFGVIGVLSALQARARTGLGQHVDISMLDCQLSMLSYIATMYLMSGELTERVGNGHFVHVPYNTFRTATRHLIIAVLTDTMWRDLVELLDDPALADPMFAHQPGRLAAKAFIEARVQGVLDQQSCEHWLEQLAAKRIPVAPVNDIAYAFEDEQTLARGMRVKVPLAGGGHVEQPGNPVKLSLAAQDVFAPPPWLGQHTEAVLRDLLGLDPGRIDSLTRQGIVQLGPLADAKLT
ncbi:CoA transferase [Phenylobacterium sp.]|uniref:CaiB/BaiF CoA transferase family protein n=1 Tax=Phenylobacterium sp. TaxID=1871053 RepID=UPI002F42D305